MIIRKAEPKDLNEIMRIIGDVSKEIQTESKNKVIERTSDGQLLCCEIDQKIIGFLGWDTEYKGNHNHWYLEQITIHKNYRGQGIGKELVKYFLDECRKNRVKKVYAYVQNHNERSLKMFLNVGWRVNSDVDKKVSDEITIEYNFN